MHQPELVGDEWQIVLRRLVGEHVYDRAARLGNWVAIWVFVFGAAVIAGCSEAYVRGWRDVRVTPLHLAASAVGLVAGGAWIRAFNLTRYRVDAEWIECTTAWPRRSWRVAISEVETAQLETSHGHWSLVLHLRAGGRRKVVFTKSMLEQLDLCG